MIINFMRSTASYAKILLALWLAVPAFAADKKAPPALDATKYAAVETHEKENISIAAEPCDDEKKCDFFRLPYVSHGLLPVRVIITNNSDQALSLDDARIQFISAAKDVIPAALPEDINRRLFNKKYAMGTKIPLIPITIHHPPIDKKITQDDADFGFRTTTVQPHTTVAGYLFYDVRDLDDPVLRDAEIYVKMVHTLDGKLQMFPFDVPFNKWLAAQSKEEKAQPKEEKKN
jgi:hypothetical protein